MEFVGSIVDFGNAPVIPVCDVARIEMISPNIVRVTFTTRNACPTDTSKTENWVQAHLTFDRADWERFEAASIAARAALVGAPHEILYVGETRRTH